MKSGVREMLFCEIAVNLGLITKSQAKQALKAQRLDEKNGLKKKIGSYLLEMHLLNEEQVDQILSRQFVESVEDTWGESFNQDDFQENAPIPKGMLFCEIAIKLGYINKSQANQALKAQRLDEKKGMKKKVGSYLLDMHFLNDDQVARILSLQAVDSMENLWGDGEKVI